MIAQRRSRADTTEGLNLAPPPGRWIIVFPSGHATATPTDEKQGDRTQVSYWQPYSDDLLKEIIPFVEATYPVYSDRANRGIAGMSMGSGQALNIGPRQPRQV